MKTRTITIELESPRDLEALMQMLETTGTLNGIERPIPVNARIEITTVKPEPAR